MRMPLGDGLGILAMLVWLSVSVGPWWIGAVVFFGVLVVNIWDQNIRRR